MSEPLDAVEPSQDKGPRRDDPTRPALARLQGWMQSVVTNSGDAASGVLSKEACAFFEPARLSHLVKASGALSPLERIEIYQEMYRPRMVDALASDYPMLRALIGDEPFEELVAAYVQDFPSRSYTLNRLGDHLPEFLETYGSARGRMVRRDLALLELAVTEVFDADETPAVAAERIVAIPAAEWPSVRFRPIAALRLLTLSTNAPAIFEALRNGDTTPPARRKREHVLVFRCDYGVRRRSLSPAAFFFLAELSNGTPLGVALDVLTRSHRSLAPDALTAWTREWIADGLFSEITHD